MKRSFQNCLMIALACSFFFSGSALANPRCEQAKKNAEKAKKTFVESVKVADDLGSRYNECMHQHKDDQRVCSGLAKEYKAARQKRKVPRQKYKIAASREKRVCKQ